MPRLMEVADLCSRTLSDPANRLRKTRKKKSSVVPPFRSGHMSAICTRLGSKGKAGVQRGRKTAGCPSFLPPAAGAANPRAPQSATPPAGVQRTPPPVRGEHAYAVRTPRWVGAVKKGCRPERRSTNVPRVPQIVSAGKIKGRTMKVRPFPYSASCR